VKSVVEFLIFIMTKMISQFLELTHTLADCLAGVRFKNLGFDCDTLPQSGLSACMSVALVHPAKAVDWNEMPFIRDTRVVPSNSVLDRGVGPPSSQRWMLPIAKLLCPSFLLPLISKKPIPSLSRKMWQNT